MLKRINQNDRQDSKLCLRLSLIYHKGLRPCLADTNALVLASLLETQKKMSKRWLSTFPIFLPTSNVMTNAN